MNDTMNTWQAEADDMMGRTGRNYYLAVQPSLDTPGRWVGECWIEIPATRWDPSDADIWLEEVFASREEAMAWCDAEDEAEEERQRAYEKSLADHFDEQPSWF